LQESDLPPWNASQSALLDFINYWEIRGIRLGDTKLSVVVMPDSKIPKSEVLTQLYGADFLSSIPRYKTKLEGSKTIEEIRAVAQEVFCRFPPLLLKHVALAETDNFPKAQEKALNDLSVFADVTNAKLPGFRFDHAYAGYIPEAKCGALVLGRSSDLSKKYDSFGAPDVVQHEMGHIFHDLTWYAQGMTSYRQKSTSLSEAVADVFALSFSGDYCIG